LGIGLDARIISVVHRGSAFLSETRNDFSALLFYVMKCAIVHKLVVSYFK